MDKKMTIYEKLLHIQENLKAPKKQFNAFGKYSFRSCEDILEGVKPLLKECRVMLLLSDELVQIGDRYYIKATATLIDTEEKYLKVDAYARETEIKKGMDTAQITGSASSYARKYALNGLFAIDDTKDDDTRNTTDKTQEKEPFKGNEFNKSGRKKPNDVGKKVDPIAVKKKQIMDLCQWFNPLVVEKKHFEASVKEKTKLNLEEKNYDEIINRLEATKKESEENKDAKK